MTQVNGMSGAVGAGCRVEIPLDLSSDQSTKVHTKAEEQSSSFMEAYFVAPASHIGRVVTAVVFLGEHRVSKSSSSLEQATQSLALENAGLCTIAFADKLAEQGYKVLVVPPRCDSKRASNEFMAVQRHLLTRAVAYLRQECDVQRVALLGIGDAADVVLRVSLEKRPEKDALAECAIAMCPNGTVAWCSDKGESKNCEEDQTVARHIPLLVLNGEKHAFVDSKAFKNLQSIVEEQQQEADAMATTTSDASNAAPPPMPLFRLRTFANQSKGFAFDDITDEDAATEAISEVLDWLAVHLYRFRVAACTSDMDPYWPQGRNGPFLNVGYKRWQEIRAEWNTQKVPKGPRAAPVPSQLIFEGLSSMRRTYDLPQQMALGDVVEILCEIWEVQQT